MGVVTVLMVVFGALLGTCVLTVVLDAIAQRCFRPLERIETATHGFPGVNK